MMCTFWVRSIKQLLFYYATYYLYGKSAILTTVGKVDPMERAKDGQVLITQLQILFHDRKQARTDVSSLERGSNKSSVMGSIDKNSSVKRITVVGLKKRVSPFGYQHQRDSIHKFGHVWAEYLLFGHSRRIWSIVTQNTPLK